MEPGGGTNAARTWSRGAARRRRNALGRQLGGSSYSGTALSRGIQESFPLVSVQRTGNCRSAQNLPLEVLL